jgi:ferric-dicitrate binding protein FerR (iron transport regulator)
MKKMTEKNDIDKLIAAFQEKKASGKELALLEKWVEADPANMHYFRETYNILNMINPIFNPDDIDLEKAKKRTFRQINQPKIMHRFFFYWQRISAVLIIPFLLAAIYLFVNDRESRDGETVYQEIVAPYGMFSQANLPDGSKVWLNGGSSLKCPLRFEKNKRNVFLRGEAYFEVQSNPGKPFVVKTDLMTLNATGTKFNIEAYKTDSVTAVTLVEGKVNVSLKSSSPTDLQPGERILYNNSTSKGSVTRTDPYKWYAWKDGLTIFRDDPLQYVFKRLSLVFNVNIILKDRELADAPYRATFEEESLDEILRLLELTAPIRFTYIKRENHSEKQIIEVYKKTSKK